MKRITKLQKKIIEAHLESAKTNNWNVAPETRDEIINCLKNCNSTFRELHEEIVTRYVSITSQLYASPNIFGHITAAYKKQYTNGFKILLNNLNIQ
jgi:hypothetical protein